MATSPLFGWEEPDDVDLVKDGAAAMRTLGDAIDTSMGDLLGGTTGQVLSKASNTNMDFTWVTSDDANAIQNAIVDAKGDLIAASANDVPARLAVGNNGETLVADSSTATGLRYQGNFAAGKNKIINGDFGIWQRGTSFAAASGAFYADRWTCDFADANPTSATVSQQTFTAGTAPVAGYEGTFFLRQTITTVGSCTILNLGQKIENVRNFAGQTATVSFWAKSDSTRTQTLLAYQNFGSGGSGLVTVATPTFSTTTSWQRFTFTLTVPSISGKTIGTNNCFQVIIRQVLAAGSVLDIWGFQVEASNVATAFQTSTGTIQGELAACQRYFFRAVNGADSASEAIGNGVWYNSTVTQTVFRFPVIMRTPPTMTLSSAGHFTQTQGGSTARTITSTSYFDTTPRSTHLDFTSSTATATAGTASMLSAGSASATMDYSAEL